MTSSTKLWSKSLGFLEGVLQKETARHLEATGILPQMRVAGRDALRPRMVICETLNVCNAECVFCPYSKQTREKGLMSMEVFRKVLRDYEDMGAGHFSLTPMVGDFLLDRLLPQRVEALEEFKYSIFPSMTTNLYGLDRYPDAVVQAILEGFSRIHVSIYGITAEECKLLTQKDHFPRLLLNLNRLARLWEESSRRCEIQLTFRLTRDQSRENLEGFLLKTCGRLFPFTSSSQYANWGSAMSGPLPGDAQYVAAQDNHSTCVLLLVALQVYWDGRVSACACCDYDACDELYVGDVTQQSLLEIFNSDKSRQIWLQHETSSLPQICKRCTFFYPVSGLTKDHPIAVKITDFIGG